MKSAAICECRSVVVKYRQPNVRWLNNQREFGASENDPLCSSSPQFFNLIKNVFLALGLENTQAKLFLNDSMELSPRRS